MSHDPATVRRVLAESHDYRREAPIRGPGIIVRRTQSPFAHILSPDARNSGWPFCWRCKTIVQEYGLENDARRYVDVVASCPERHTGTDSIRIEKPVDYTDEWLSEVMRTLVFFRQGAA